MNKLMDGRIESGGGLWDSELYLVVVVVVVSVTERCNS